MYIKDNELDQAVIQSSDVLQERDGKVVKRFWNLNGESFIFKKTSQENIDKERMIRNSPVPTPKLLETNGDCAVFEDLGIIKHPYESEYMGEIIDKLIQIHHLPLSMIKNDFPPRFHSIKSTLEFFSENKVLFSEVFERIGLSHLFAEIEGVLIQEGKNLCPLQVLSHGDFHVENMAVKSGELYVFDWEFLCVNDCYDDLFCLLDITIPYYERVIPSEIKKEALRKYFEGMKIKSASFQTFHRGYLLYAMLYLFQIIYFIEKDKLNGKHPTTRLSRQFENTIMNLASCYKEYQLVN